SRHLMFTKSNDLYILPNGLNLVYQKPPTIKSVTPSVDGSGNRAAVLAGSRLNSGTRILFDGLSATVSSVDEINDTLTVVPPKGASGHKAIIEALNGDGQTSLFLDLYSLPSYTYDAAATPSVSVSPLTLRAGAESMVEITGTNTNFTSGQTLAGFGTSDVAVRQVWVKSTTSLLANVHVSSSTPTGAAQLTVLTGFETAVQENALQIQSQDTTAIVVNPLAVNPVTGLQSIYAGGRAKVQVANLTAGATISATLGDKAVTSASAESGALNFIIPSTLGTGPAVFKLTVGSVSADPVVLAIDAAPPVIQSVAPLPAVPGDPLVVTVSGLADSNVVDSPESVLIYVGGVEHQATSVTVSNQNSSVHHVRFTLSDTVAAGNAVAVMVQIGNRRSQATQIQVSASSR
ncbi:MAG: hypothetical protein ABFD89_02235, partial [Bryobacteraceae bacterium]